MKDKDGHYWFLLGWLTAKDAPREVLAALEDLRGWQSDLLELGPKPPLITPQETAALLRPESPPERKRKPANLTPEQRAAIGARLKAGREKKAGSTTAPARAPSPGEAHPPL